MIINIISILAFWLFFNISNSILGDLQSASNFTNVNNIGFNYTNGMSLLYKTQILYFLRINAFDILKKKEFQYWSEKFYLFQSPTFI
jgi:hypothetical protein